jgi:hypothetical protein
MKVQMDDYTSRTYRELFELEVQRKVKQVPLAFAKPSTLLPAAFAWD